MTTFAMEGSEQVFSCFTCGTNFPSSRGLAVHRTKKHDRPYRVPVVKVARIRTTNLKRKLCDSEDVHHEGGADAPVESSNEMEEYDETEERDEFQAPADDFDDPDVAAPGGLAGASCTLAGWPLASQLDVAAQCIYVLC